MSRTVTEFLPLLKKRIDKLRAEMGEAGEMQAIVAEARLQETEFIHEFLAMWNSVGIDASVFYARRGPT